MSATTPNYKYHIQDVIDRLNRENREEPDWERLTLNRIADRADISRQTLTRALHEKTSMRVGTLFDIWEAFLQSDPTVQLEELVTPVFRHKKEYHPKSQKPLEAATVQPGSQETVPPTIPTFQTPQKKLTSAVGINNYRYYAALQCLNPSAEELWRYNKERAAANNQLCSAVSIDNTCFLLLFERTLLGRDVDISYPNTPQKSHISFNKEIDEDAEKISRLHADFTLAPSLSGVLRLSMVCWGTKIDHFRSGKETEGAYDLATIKLENLASEDKKLITKEEAIELQDGDIIVIGPFMFGIIFP